MPTKRCSYEQGSFNGRLRDEYEYGTVRSMKRQEGKSHCPINFALETFGDAWSLLIIRDIIFSGKRTYGEFLRSEERIATNVLAERLMSLEQKQLLRKHPHVTDRRKDLYTLTEKGLDLIPLLLEMVKWSTKYDEESSALKEKEFVNRIYNDREELIESIRRAVLSNNAVVKS